MITKSQRAFYRKLYLAHLISEDKHNLLSLQALTQMPRRTLQDTMAAMADIGIEVEFVQTKERHNAGYYHLSDWGPICKTWLAMHWLEIQQSLTTEVPSSDNE
ncbi:winged helix-turn-helix domain-containing protein [Shewanella sp. SR44-3]|uniref:winged helix-turn-helix domain-containing protein n=1 Tax=unclassified Shewanella TaxID=196818 RepID=UPI0028737731|nr:winged helix-turn-helix domain-containing protein [Shewanella sp. SR44-3]